MVRILMRICRTYLLLFLAAVFVIGCSKTKKKSPLLLVETYGRNDTKPFGGFVAYSRIRQLLNDRFVETIEEPFDETIKNRDSYTESKKSLYLLITRNLLTTDKEVSAMIEYVEAGNDLFISADYMDNNLLEKLNCKSERQAELVVELAGVMRDTHIKLEIPGNPAGDNLYSYYYYPFLNSFSGYEEETTKILGVNEIGKPNFLVHFIGKGRVYLHSAPRAFSNNFLLRANNYLYLDNLFAYFRVEPKNIYWDEYYKKQDIRRKRTNSSGSSESFSSFNVINKHPALKSAFWLAVLLLLLYILFNIKRKQRIINPIVPNANTTLVFTETVGRLYLEKKNNKNIAEKMITYFYEYVRTRYYLNTTKINEEFISALSRKSGVDHAGTEQLVKTIQLVQQQNDINDDELLSLNRQVQNFYKTKTDGRTSI